MASDSFVAYAGHKMIASTISVVVLSYNRPESLATALASVFNQSGHNLDVIVVDNLSPNSTEIARIVAVYPLVRFLPQTKNLGFATGMNIGIHAATGEYLHLTEDDITLDAGFYDELLRHAKRNPCALLSGLLRERGREECLFAGARLHIGWRYTQQTTTSPENSDCYSTEMLVGSMIFGLRTVLLHVGGFRDEFFVYFEDAEFSWRARLRGVPLFLVPSACGWHKPAQYHFKPFIEFHKLKNYFAINLLYMPIVPLILLAAKYFCYTTVRKASEGRSLSFLFRIWIKSLRAIPFYLLERLRMRR